MRGKIAPTIEPGGVTLVDVRRAELKVQIWAHLKMSLFVHLSKIALPARLHGRVAGRPVDGSERQTRR